MKQGRLIILLVEDEEDDIVFVKHASVKAGAGHNVYAVRDGEEAVRYLRGEGEYADRQRFPVPNVVMTDLKMPRMDGYDLLRWLRHHVECSIIPVIVYSSSSIDADVRHCYELGANSYITKPSDLDEMVEILRLIYEYWSRCECPAMRRG